MILKKQKNRFNKRCKGCRLMRLCSIASGSSGNCIYVGSDKTHLLVDAGISGKKVEFGLNSLDLTTGDLDGILVGPYLVDGSLEMKMFDRQGHEVSMKKESTDVPISYMKEAGYLPGECPQTEHRPEKKKRRVLWTKSKNLSMNISTNRL